MSGKTVKEAIEQAMENKRVQKYDEDTHKLAEVVGEIYVREEGFRVGEVNGHKFVEMPANMSLDQAGEKLEKVANLKKAFCIDRKYGK